MKIGERTIDERDAAIAILLKKRAEAKRRRVDLESELRAAGKSLYDIGGALRNVTGGSMGSRVDYILPKLAKVPAICDLGRLRILLEELKEVEVYLAQLKHNASEMEVD